MTMRRQVRPFVTEVRASGRRPKDAGFAVTRPDREGPRENDTPRSVFSAASHHHDKGDDSYDAVMKAADALFSGHRSESKLPKEPERPLSQPTVPVTQMAHTGRNGAYARASADADAVFAPPADPAATLKHDRDQPENGGRILQAIEAPEEDSLAPLEAERTPKRRGRKPGSKNRPKIPAMTSVAAVEAATVTPDLLPHASQARRPDAGARTAALVASLAEPPSPATPTASVRRVSAVAATVGKKREPFAWVRTKLRPGEKWKRRLPKVAW